MVVLVNGGALAIDDILEKKPAAVVEAFNVAFGSHALAASLFGDENRWGKLPITLYPHSFIAENSMDNYDMSLAPGRTYKYYTGKPLFPFGHGLSLTDFKLSCSPSAKTLPLIVTCNVANVGTRAGDEAVLVFHKAVDTARAQAKHPVPKRALIDFDRVSLPCGAEASLTFTITEDKVSLIDETGAPRLYSGMHTVIFSRGHGDEVSIDIDLSMQLV